MEEKVLQSITEGGKEGKSKATFLQVSGRAVSAMQQEGRSCFDKECEILGLDLRTRI